MKSESWRLQDRHVNKVSYIKLCINWRWNRWRGKTVVQILFCGGYRRCASTFICINFKATPKLWHKQLHIFRVNTHFWSLIPSYAIASSARFGQNWTNDTQLSDSQTEYYPNDSLWNVYASSGCEYPCYFPISFCRKGGEMLLLCFQGELEI